MAAIDSVMAEGAGLLVVAKRDRLARDVVLAARVEGLARRVGARVVSVAGEGEGDRHERAAPAAPRQFIVMVSYVLVGMLIPTTYGLLVEHSDATVKGAHARMRDLLARLETPGCAKAQHTIGQVRKLWTGFDGTKSQRGVRVLPTDDAVRVVSLHASDPRVDVRRQVFAALRDAGTAALAAAAALASGLEDPEPTVRIQALRVFAPRRPVETPMPEGALPNKLDPPEVLVPVVRRAFEDPTLTVRWGAVAALSTIAPRAELEAVLNASEPKSPHKHQEWAAVYAELS